MIKQICYRTDVGRQFPNVKILRIDGASTPNYRRIASSTVKHNDDYYDYHDPAPTQGKVRIQLNFFMCNYHNSLQVAKSLQKIGSPAFKDYGDVVRYFTYYLAF